MGDMRNTYKTSIGNPEGMKPFGRPRHRLEDSIKMDLKEIKWKFWTAFNWFSKSSSGWLL
jgi:hypothetical protein